MPKKTKVLPIMLVGCVASACGGGSSDGPAGPSSGAVPPGNLAGGPAPGAPVAAPPAPGLPPGAPPLMGIDWRKNPMSMPIPYEGSTTHVHLMGCMAGYSVHEEKAIDDVCRIEYKCLNAATDQKSGTGCTMGEIEVDTDIEYRPVGATMEETHGLQIELKHHNFIADAGAIPGKRYELGYKSNSATGILRMDVEMKDTFRGKTVYEEKPLDGSGSHVLMQALSGTPRPDGTLDPADAVAGYTFFVQFDASVPPAMPGDWLVGSVFSLCSRPPKYEMK